MIRAPPMWTRLLSLVPWVRGPRFLEACSLHAGLPDSTVEATDARTSAGAFSGVISEPTPQLLGASLI